MRGPSHPEGERVALIQERMMGQSTHDIAEGLRAALVEGSVDTVPAWIEAIPAYSPTAKALRWNPRKRQSLEHLGMA